MMVQSRLVTKPQSPDELDAAHVRSALQRPAKPAERSRMPRKSVSLYHRFQSSELYKNYRDRQNRSHQDAAASDPTWPDELETAFFNALETWPPMGRGKILHNNKNRGRNELIADHIFQLTGVQRTRKQVSSHIQVLKQFVNKDSHIMKWLCSDSMGEPSSGPGRKRSRTASTAHRKRRCREVIRSPPSSQASSTIAADEEHLDHHADDVLNVLKPVSFAMFAQLICKDGTLQRLHTYTSTSPAGTIQDHELSDMQPLQSSRPILWAICSGYPTHCDILHAKSSLAIPKEEWKGADGKIPLGIDLGISFVCKSITLTADTQLACRNRFFKNKRCLETLGTSLGVHLAPRPGSSDYEAQVKFGSQFWAETFTHLTEILKQPVDTIKMAEQAVTDYVEGIEMLQEFFVRDPDTDLERTVLIIYWEFTASQNGRGRTSWSRLILPEPPTSLSPRSSLQDWPTYIPDPNNYLPCGVGHGSVINPFHPFQKEFYCAHAAPCCNRCFSQTLPRYPRSHSSTVQDSDRSLPPALATPPEFIPRNEPAHRPLRKISPHIPGLRNGEDPPFVREPTESFSDFSSGLRPIPSPATTYLSSESMPHSQHPPQQDHPSSTYRQPVPFAATIKHEYASSAPAMWGSLEAPSSAAPYTSLGQHMSFRPSLVEAVVDHHHHHHHHHGNHHLTISQPPFANTTVSPHLLFSYPGSIHEPGDLDAPDHADRMMMMRSHTSPEPSMTALWDHSHLDLSPTVSG